MRKLMLAAAVCGVVLAGSAQAVNPDAIKWKKITLTDQFMTEGSYYADFNRDGKMDVVIGPWWYEGPDFTKKHQVYAPTGEKPDKSYDPHGYSDNFLTYCYDFNGDGYPDVLVYGFPGKEGVVWVNPGKNVDGPWKKVIVFDSIDNESPGFGDVDGDGRPEGIFHTGGYLGYAKIDWNDPLKKWSFVRISPKGNWQRFTHGYGIGDVNGDGKTDILEAHGWWENPGKPLSPGQTWKLHPVNFAREGAQMYAYDVDGDGLNDVITVDHPHLYGMQWCKQVRDASGNISFEKHVILDPKTGEGVGAAKGVKFSEPHAVELIDVDGDGLKDIVTGKRWWAHGPGGDVDPMVEPVLYWFQLRRNPDKSVDWIPHLIGTGVGVGTQVSTVDLNGDGIIDVIVGNKRGAHIYLSEKP